MTIVPRNEKAFFEPGHIYRSHNTNSFIVILDNNDRRYIGDDFETAAYVELDKPDLRYYSPLNPKAWKKVS